MECCKQSENNTYQWFDACKNGDIAYVGDNINSLSQLYENRKYQIQVKQQNKPKFDIVMGGVVNLFYALFYDHHKIFQMLLPAEWECKTNQNIFLPTEQYAAAFQPSIQTLSPTVEFFFKHDVKWYAQIPANSNILHFALYCQRLDFFLSVFDLLDEPKLQQLIQEQNAEGQNVLFLLIKYPGSFQRTRHLLPRFEDLLQEIGGENVVTLSFRYQLEFLEHFVGMNDKKLVRMMDDYVELLEEQESYDKCDRFLQTLHKFRTKRTKPEKQPEKPVKLLQNRLSSQAEKLHVGIKNQTYDEIMSKFDEDLKELQNPVTKQFFSTKLASGHNSDVE